MPDISMCKGGQCPLKDKCYRHRAVPYEHGQDWDEFMYKDEGSCACFKPIRDGDKLREAKHA